MNVVDLVITSVIGFMALAGLRSGILKPITGIGGMVAAVSMAMRHHDELAVVMTGYFDSETMQRTAAFALITLAVIAGARLMSVLVKHVLSTLILGWLDHAAGAAAGVAVGVAAAGTVAYFANALDQVGGSSLVADSTLAPEIQRASVVSDADPWCSSIDAVAMPYAHCTDFSRLVKELTGLEISADPVPDELDLDALDSLADLTENAVSVIPASGLTGVISAQR